MKLVYLTEIGFSAGALQFINAPGQFVDLKPAKNNNNVDLLLAVIHDESGEVANMELIATSDQLEEICLLDKQALSRAFERANRKDSHSLIEDMRNGSLLKWTEFLASIWMNVRPIALEKVS